MPYTVRKEDDKYCVKKKHQDGSLSAVPGGCHPTKDEALKHMQALIINEPTSE